MAAALPSAVGRTPSRIPKTKTAKPALLRNVWNLKYQKQKAGQKNKGV
jgi:hypothetical protein